MKRHSQILFAFFFFVLAGIGATIGIRFLLGGNEDSWECTENMWVAHGMPQTQKPIGECGVITENVRQTDGNFSEEGNLLKDSSGVWKLLYEKPGAPALSASLLFSDQTVCVLGTAYTKCNLTNEEIGQRAKIKGDPKGEVIVVSLISFLK
jgi:hypothetical protein